MACMKRLPCFVFHAGGMHPAIAGFKAQLTNNYYINAYIAKHTTLAIR